VRSGTVRTFTTAKNGDEQILAFHLPGELLGLDGMDNDIHSCSAIALDTTIVCELRVTELHNLCLRIEGLQRQLIGLLSDEICKDQNMLLLMARSNAEQKLASFFMNLSKRLQQRGQSPNEFELSMTRCQISNYLGITNETVSRIITKFRQQRLIQADKKSIKILNAKRLQSVADSYYDQ
jgi:CRP/FNR family transcriptional regulator